MAFVLMSVTPGAPLPLSHLSENPSRLLRGVDGHAWCVVALLIVDSWMSALLVKGLSSVVKGVAKCVSLIVLYAISVFFIRAEVFRLPQALIALLVANGTGMYAYAS